jgi:hypothetical protein
LIFFDMESSSGSGISGAGTSSSGTSKRDAEMYALNYKPCVGETMLPLAFLSNHVYKAVQAHGVDGGADTDPAVLLGTVTNALLVNRAAIQQAAARREAVPASGTASGTVAPATIGSIGLHNPATVARTVPSVDFTDFEGFNVGTPGAPGVGVPSTKDIFAAGIVCFLFIGLSVG